jgi:hypothetical protein
MKRLAQKAEGKKGFLPRATEEVATLCGDETISRPRRDGKEAMLE